MHEYIVCYNVLYNLIILNDSSRRFSGFTLSTCSHHFNYNQNTTEHWIHTVSLVSVRRPFLLYANLYNTDPQLISLQTGTGTQVHALVNQRENLNLK